MNTDQEKFWQGEFGNEYAGRNQSDVLLASNISFFSKLISRTGPIKSVVEFGCNVGMNLKAIEKLLPECSLSGIEINTQAVADLRGWGKAKVIEDSIIDVNLDNTYELSLIKGVLIHINPDKLNDVYERLYSASDKYICIAEYYNPSPVSISYRGHDDRLFKRDFAGEFMDKYKDLTLVDYGFLYHRDPTFPQDDITWFLMSK